MLSLIGNPSEREVARTFGVTVTTVRRWMRRGAPRAVRLAVWWLTPQGVATVDAESFTRHRWRPGWPGPCRARCASWRGSLSTCVPLGSLVLRTTLLGRQRALLRGPSGPSQFTSEEEPAAPPPPPARTPLPWAAPPLRGPLLFCLEWKKQGAHSLHLSTRKRRCDRQANQRMSASTAPSAAAEAPRPPAPTSERMGSRPAR